MFEDAARLRAQEAKALEDAMLMCGAVYLAGYVVECKLKALLTRMGKSFPRGGSQGHNLLLLWDQAGLSSRTLSGHRKAFLDTWDTSLRYMSVTPSTCQDADLLAGARDLAAFVSTKIRYARSPRKG